MGKKPYTKAFTLVELLVVIAIIGLIASIVLVNLQGVRGRGRVAAGKQFSSQLQNTLGDQAVGIWRFNEGSGATAYDNAGYGNNGTLTNSPVWKTESECGLGLGSCILFDGINDQVLVPDSSSLDTTTALTISAWINFTTLPSANGKTGGIVEKWTGTGDQRSYGFYVPTSNKLSFIADEDGLSAGNVAVVANDALSAGQWYHVVIAYSSSTIRLYVNGQLQSNTGSIPSIYASTVAVAIGGHPTSSTQEPFAGMIDDVYIFASGLTTAQVQQLYAEGRQRHLAEQ